MHAHDMSWFDVQTYLKQDDRAVVPLGSIEQHAYLSLGVDNILSQRVAAEAAEPLGVPVFPGLSYGLTPYQVGYPGTVTLRVATYLAILRDLMDGLSRQGFRRILFVNGHGGNSSGRGLLQEWMMDHPETTVKWHDWWSAPKTMAKVREIDPVASHASWMETFPWTRLEGATPPDAQKPMTDVDILRLLSPAGVRDYMGDGNMGGEYAKPDATMMELWKVGVEETRAAIEGPWSA
ncbi:MAG: creatininase family protein [Trueperaceae bacterium]|nr:creatininase family protein [Trueperaceae bacterium]